MSVVKEIRELMSRCSRLEQQVSKLPTRIGSSVGGGSEKLKKSEIWIEADTYPEIDAPTEENMTLLARIMTGDQKDQIYKISHIDKDGGDEAENLYWECISESYDADDKDSLVNNAHVQKYALGRVGSIYYRRNQLNNGWEALNEFE